MNVSNTASFTFTSFIKHKLSGNIHFLCEILWFALKSARTGLRSIVVLPLGLLWDVCSDLLGLCLTLACICIIVISISLVKSLKPRYNFDHEAVDNIEDENTSNSRAIERPNDIFSPTRPKSASSGWPIKRYIERQFPFALRLWSRLKVASEDVNQMCSPALSVPDIESIYKRLSWAHTQADIESANWLNQTLCALWPSIKTILNAIVFNDLLKPKKDGDKKLDNESKKLSKKRPKMSVYLSCRRKLYLLRQFDSAPLNACRNSVEKSIFRTAIYVTRLFWIYAKQFIVDYVSYLFKKGKKKQRQGEKKKKFEINLGKLLTEEKNFKRVVAEQEQHTVKSWSGFDNSTENRVKKEGGKMRQERKLKSAPPHVAKTRMSHSLLSARGMVKLRERRLKLATRFRKAYEKSKKRNELTFERIQLGDSIPTINGVKYIDERNDLMIDPVKTSRHLVGSDEKNMRFVGELSYESDKKFQIKLSLHPLLGRIRLVNLKVQIRFYVTLNHTINELNRELEIFDTPEELLYPAINYVQLSMVDMPSFDWKLDRPSRRGPSEAISQKRPKVLKQMTNYIYRWIDPVDIINHSYFKFIIRSIIHLGLKWFQPFDIRIGPHLYLKTIC